MIIAAYLLGAVPSTLWLVRAVCGVDIRTVGDGTQDARSVNQVAGWKWAALAAGLELLKSALAVLAAGWLGFDQGVQMGAGLAAVLGSDFPVFAGFKGGQGLAAVAGAILGLAPLEGGLGLAAFLAVLVLSRRFNLATIAGLVLTVLLLNLPGQAVDPAVFAIVLILTIPAKRALDTPRRRALRRKKSQTP